MCEKNSDTYYDSLVNGYNEKWIRDQYEKLRNHPTKQKYMLIYMNIKNFRLFNILYGHHAGFSCSLDDFGNGYSSFTVLLNADLDSVKMDWQFFLPNLTVTVS